MNLDNASKTVSCYRFQFSETNQIQYFYPDPIHQRQLEILCVPELSVDGMKVQQKRLQFEFDHVFSPEVSQLVYLSKLIKLYLLWTTQSHCYRR